MSVQKLGFKPALRASLAAIVLMTMLLSTALPDGAVQAEVEGAWTYTQDGVNATITDYDPTIGGNVVVIPSTLGGYPVTSIGANAFREKNTLTSVTIPDSVTSIGDGAFKYCSGLTSVTIGDHVTSIGDSAFEYCSGLTSVSIPNSVTSIGASAFYNCSGLTSVSIPNSVTSIGFAVFRGCENLPSVSIPNSVTSIGEWAFLNCKKLTSVSIPNSVTSIGKQAFNGCDGLTGVTIGNGVTSIGEGAFQGCPLTSVTIGSSVASIGKQAFYGCTVLPGVTIPASVTSIGISAFEYCSALTTPYFLGNAPTGTTDMFANCGGGFKVYYVCGKTGWASPWYGYTTSATVGAATTIAVNLGDSQSAIVGTAVAIPPSVIVKDACGNPVSGVSVIFAVATGEGTATGLTTTTNASGIATVGSWTLGPTAGSNTLTATSGTLTGSPVTFTATGTAGAVATVEVSGDASIVSGVESSGYTAVSKDAAGNIVSGDTYTWSRANGTGTASITSTNKLTGVLVGTVTMTATSALNAGVHGGKSVTVTIGAVATVEVSGADSIVSGVESNGYTAVSKDAAGNTVSGDTYNWSETNGTGTANITSTNKLTGVLVGTVTMTATSVLNTGVHGDKSVTVTAGTATHVNVETANDGSGIVVVAQNIASGGTVSAYAISRDASNNFVDNVAADTWSMTGPTTGGVTDTDLSPLTGASTTFTGHVAGTGVIHVTSGSLTPGDSGTIIVTAGTATSLTVSQAPASSGTVDVIFTTQPWILVKDASGNPVSGTVVTVSLASGGGALRNTLTATSGDDGLAKFTDLAYNKTDAFRLHFAAGALNVDATAFGPLLAGAAALVKVETLATGSGAVVPDQSLAAGNTLTVYSITRDQFDNFVANAAADNWSFASKSGVVDTDLAAVSDNKSAIMTGHLAGTGVIRASIGSLTPTDSGIITVTTSAATIVRVETAVDGTGTLVGAQSLAAGSPLTVYSITRDVGGNFVANAAADNWTLIGMTVGVVDGDLAAVSDNRSAVMTGHLAGTGIIRAAIAGLTPTNSGIITVTAGTATLVKVETLATGSGAVVPAQSLAAGSTLTVYSITRDQFGNFVANTAADNWTLSGKTVGVADTDLAAVSDNRSAVMTGHLAGTGIIRAAIGGLTPTNSGIITVTVAPPPPPPPTPTPTPVNPLIGTGVPTSHGSSGTGTSPTATTQTVSLPNIQIQSASLSASKVAPGTPVTVTADITNRSTVNGIKKVTVYVNGQVETAQGITVNSGGYSKLAFYVTRSEPGDYSVYVDGVQAGSFMVEDAIDPNIILFISMSLIALSLILAVVMVARRKLYY